MHQFLEVCSLFAYAVQFYRKNRPSVSRFTGRLSGELAASSKRSVCTTLERLCQFWNFNAYHLNLIANMFMNCFVISCILLFAVYISVQKPSKRQQKLLIQSCMQKLCRKPLCSDPVLFAEAVQSSCRSCSMFCGCLPVSTVLDFHVL